MIKRLYLQRLKYLIIFLIPFGIYVLGLQVYRPYIYSNGIFDYYLADTFTNIVAVPGLCFFFLIINPINKRFTSKVIIVKFFCSVIVLELLNLPFENGFDYKDIIATIIGALLTYVSWDYIVECDAEEVKNEVF
ncbi:hypothetical protein L3049_19545 [Labilibaculum sp. DW002]|jgi:hypothetical protein|uniref:VanZ-like domain-containing protein n=1 Tax=Paralabilibaculum antarcticum TaxID=2912572 RepID=A0ABT5VXQ3_9BACT|nr:hypothetical protein [Labilibaculum sp. DW002]MDE5420191.1 hypothetical protein [Labilibaculum sp. DW002]